MADPTQPSRSIPASPLALKFPQSLAVYGTYAEAQRAVDALADAGFPVENCMIVGTDLKQVERITGRLTWGRVAAAGALSGVWLGLLLGLLLGLFASDGRWWPVLLAAALFGAAFGVIWGLVGYALTRGRRDFSSVRTVVATRQEVLVEHRHREAAHEILARTPGLLPNPFAQ